MIEVLMTATRRPEIIERTLKSFRQNMFVNMPVSVIVNIDPVGPGSNESVINTIKRWCDLKAVITPAQAHFGRAFKRVWSLAENRFCLWLEDDWELKRHISLADMMDTLSLNPGLATLRLPWVRTERTYMKNWRYKFPYTMMKGRAIFKCPEENKREVGFCGHPSLLNGQFVKQCALLINPELNPEKQFHMKGGPLMDAVDLWDYGVYAEPNQPAAVEDIGRKWMVQNNLRKAGNKAWFQSWEAEA